jgi:Lipocalin-like domain
MNRPGILGIAAMTALGLAVLSGSVVAQQKSLKEQLVGSWTLVSSDHVRPDGSNLKQFGADPTGINVFDANGRLFVLIGSADDSKIASNNPNKTNSDKGGGLIPESMAYYGTYLVDEAEKVVMLHLEASTFPNLVGTDQKRVITSLTADELRYSNPAAMRGLQVHQVWKRTE